MSPDGVSAPTATPDEGGAFALEPYIHDTTSNAHALDFMVEGVHCGGCVAKIERALAAEPDVTKARVNLSTRRLALEWTGGTERGNALAASVAKLGYGLVPFDPERQAPVRKRTCCAPWR
jgi:copper chaperone CopZ